MNLSEIIENRKKIICTELSSHVDKDYVQKISSLVDVATVTSIKKTAKDTNFDTKPEQESIDKSLEVKKTYSIETIPTITCRDHEKTNNFLSNLKTIGINNLLLLYGDPNEPPHKSNYYFKNSGELVKWLRDEESSSLNRKLFSLCVAGNPASPNLEKEIDSIAKKYEAGADVIVTQPVFDVEQGLKYVEALKARGLKMHLLYGLLLFKTANSPDFIEKRFGIKIPENVKSIVKEKGPEESVKIAQDVYSGLLKHVTGFQVYPYGGPEKTITLLQNLRGFIKESS